ncbi:GGDEF domain-containing protein [Sulfurimonas sp. MAG313]|nr:GGDEF domain-containing protein [Sulfurimonas sp. MAG313]MDF1880166.1 GGDEF domain-containing protein [Sulfurimonas sp. MAG313]
MNITIKKFFILSALLLLSIYAILIFYIIELDKINASLQSLQNSSFKMSQKADELRQSSDDLTRFARTYVITADPLYKTQYFTILDIRNGKAKRPFEYEGIYWDLLEPKRSQLHPQNDPISLEVEMKLLPYTEYEFSRLKEAENQSNKLVNLEVQAFNAMIGLYIDDKGNYTLHKEANQDLAISLLHSEQYHLAKQSIMLPINYFLSSLSKRITQDTQELQEKTRQLFKKIFALIALDFFLFLLTMYVISKKVLSPISKITTMITKIKQKKEIYKSKFYKDEIGFMAEEFYTMHERIQDDHKKLQDLANIDELTGIYNRRFFFDVSNKILKSAYRNDQKVSLLIFDIDNFKSINDSYGHQIGDSVLQHLVGTISARLRQGDVFARYGGDEFVILLQDTNLEVAFEISKSLCKTVKDKVFAYDKLVHIPISISAGVSEYRHPYTDLKSLIKSADIGLHQAKREGRNRVVQN